MDNTEPLFIRRNNDENTKKLNSKVLRRKGCNSFENDNLRHPHILPKRKKYKNRYYKNPTVRKFSIPFRKLCWIIIQTTGLTVSAYNIYSFWRLYFIYPIVLNVGVKNNFSVIDPSVTLCNLNKYRVGRGTHIWFNTGGNAESKKGTALVLSQRKEFASCSSMQSLHNASLDKLMFLMTYASSTEEERFEAGHQSSDFIQDCVFNDAVCSGKNFTLFQSLRYGNCYTFKKFYDSQRKSQELHLILNLENWLYHPSTPSVGARVVIHGSSEMPDLDRHGFNVMPGFENYLSISPTVTQRLPSPYRDRCRDYSYSSAGSQDQCVRKCMQDINFYNCNCVDPSLIDDSRKHCNLTDATDVCCLDDVDLQMSSNGPPCDCPLPCASIKFNVQKSLAIWPSVPKMYQIFFKMQNDLLGSNSHDMNEIQENWNYLKDTYISVYRLYRLKLKISLSASEYQIYEQLPRFEEVQLLSVAGGELGIWLGFCIATLFGIVEIIFSFLWKGCNAF